MIGFNSVRSPGSIKIGSCFIYPEFEGKALSEDEIGTSSEELKEYTDSSDGTNVWKICRELPSLMASGRLQIPDMLRV